MLRFSRRIVSSIASRRYFSSKAEDCPFVLTMSLKCDWKDISPAEIQRLSHIPFLNLRNIELLCYERFVDCYERWLFINFEVKEVIRK